MGSDTVQFADPPGAYIEEELRARGWSRRELASIMSMSERELRGILAGRQAITPELARALGGAFDVSADFFINLQARYDGRMNRPSPDRPPSRQARSA